MLVFKDITAATNERTVISAVIPRTAVGNSAPVVVTRGVRPEQVACLLGCLNSLTLDFLARPKVGGLHLNFFIVKQFPILPPNAYTSSDLDFIVPRVLELTYTAQDVSALAEDLGFNGAPFRWDEERRTLLCAELDAYYAHLYGLTRDELRYILDPLDVCGPDFPGETFRGLKDNDIRQFNEYRTQRLVLDAWDRLRLEPRNRDGRYDAGQPSRLTDTASTFAHSDSAPLLAAQTVRSRTRTEARSMPLFPTGEPPNGF